MPRRPQHRDAAKSGLPSTPTPYRDQLRDAVAERRHELGVAATVTQPAHVVAIIGSVPTTSPEATRSWISSAARIEAYREEWAVAPEGAARRCLPRAGVGRCRSHH